MQSKAGSSRPFVSFLFFAHLVKCYERMTIFILAMSEQAAGLTATSQGPRALGSYILIQPNPSSYTSTPASPKDLKFPCPVVVVPTFWLYPGNFSGNMFFTIRKSQQQDGDRYLTMEFLPLSHHHNKPPQPSFCKSNTRITRSQSTFVPTEFKMKFTAVVTLALVTLASECDRKASG
jgi:hypothetical protein